MSEDPSCLISLDGRFQRVNPAWERLSGWTSEDLFARPFLDLIHPDDRAAAAVAISGLADAGAQGAFEARCRGKDGADRRLEWRAIRWPGRRVICATAREVDGQQRLERALIEASDREKERVGRELHDGLCQNLAGIAALSATLARKLAAHDDPAQAAAEITALLQQAIGDARDLARGLNPVGLAKIGLAAALEILAANVEALHPIACVFASDRRCPRLDPSVEAHLYRIAQEAVNNAVAHGRGKRIAICLRVRDGKASLTIRDNGVGIPEGPVAGEGIGLRSIEYRARMIGASLRVERLAPRGTAIICTFPLQKEPRDARRSD